MGYQGDDHDDPLVGGGYSSRAYFPGEHTSSAELSFSSRSIPDDASQSLNNVFQYAASGSQYHNGSQTFSPENPLLAYRPKDFAPAAKRRHGLDQGAPRMSMGYAFGPIQDFLSGTSNMPGMSPQTSGIAQMPGHGTYIGTDVPAPEPFGGIAGTQDYNSPLLWDSSPTVVDTASSPFPDNGIDGGFQTGNHLHRDRNASAPSHRRPSVSVPSYLPPAPTPPSRVSQASYNDDPEDSENHKRLLACPFNKHNPRKHNRGACSGPGFSSVSRMKEHIYRKHAEADNTCSSCLESFKTPDQLRHHARKRPVCEVRPEGERPDWMTAAQKEEIRSKKRTKHRQTEEEKWERIYQILFGWDGDVPSPYYENDGNTPSETDSEDCYRISKCDVEDLRAHNPPWDMKCRFESGVGEIMGQASGPQLEKITDLACDFFVEMLGRCAL